MEEVQLVFGHQLVSGKNLISISAETVAAGMEEILVKLFHAKNLTTQYSVMTREVIIKGNDKTISPDKPSTCQVRQQLQQR